MDPYGLSAVAVSGVKFVPEFSAPPGVVVPPIPAPIGNPPINGRISEKTESGAAPGVNLATPDVGNNKKPSEKKDWWDKLKDRSREWFRKDPSHHGWSEHYHIFGKRFGGKKLDDWGKWSK